MLHMYTLGHLLSCNVLFGFLLEVHVTNGDGREVAETCSRIACSDCNDREGPQMSGHHKPLLSRYPCRTDHMLLFIPHWAAP